MNEIKKEPIDYRNDLKIIYKTEGGEEVYRCENSIVVKLPDNRNTLSTSFLNGGYQENLQAVYNHESPPTRGHCARDLEGGSIEAYMEIHSIRLGLDPKRTTGMSTAAKMRNAAISSRSFRDLEVTAIVTAGIEVNGGRAGDPASFYEESEKLPVKGTINTILIINSHIPVNALCRTMMTATEAKTVAIQQLMAPSRYSTGIATGSGTDQICIISNMASPNYITWTGKHSKAGELIGKCIIDATTEALAKQNNLTAESQRDMLVRLDRFGIDEKKYWNVASTLEGENKQDIFIHDLRNFSKNPAVVALTASILHLVDEMDWGLIPEATAKRSAVAIMKNLPELVGMKIHSDYNTILNNGDDIIENWIRISSWCVKTKN